MTRGNKGQPQSPAPGLDDPDLSGATTVDDQPSTIELNRTANAGMISNVASPSKRIGAQTLFEIRSIMANGEQLLLCVLLPLGVLFGLSQTEVLNVFGYAGSAESHIAVATAAALSLSIASVAFTGQAIQTGFDRRYGVLRQLATTPLGARGLVIAKILAVYAVVTIQFCLVLVCAGVLGFSSHISITGLIATGLSGTAATVSLALFMAGTLRAEAVLALSNIIWVVSAGVGGIVVAHPGLWGALASLTPFGALGDAMRAAMVGGYVAFVPLLILLTWAGLGLVACMRWFSFESK